MSKPINWTRFWRQFKIYVIFAIAVFAFAILGMFQNSSIVTGGGVAAEVNKQPISLKEFRQSYDRFQSRMGGNFGSGPQQKYFENMIRQNVLNQLITLEVVSQSAHKLGVVTSDAEVSGKIVDILEGIPNISDFGDTRRDQYNALLRSNRTKAKEFESSLRKEIALERIRTLFERAVYMTPSEIEIENHLKNTELNLSYISFKKSDLVDESSVSSSAVEEKLSKEAKSVEDYYNQNKLDYTEKEQVRARHILIGFKAGDKKSEESALTRIKKIESRLASEKFEDLAKELSEDPGSKEKGGDLGFFTRGKMVKEFENIAFSQELNKVSAPVKSNFGYHLIRTEEKKAKVVKALDDVKKDIAKKLIAKSKVSDAIKALESSLGNSRELFKKLKSHKMKWEETGTFNLANTNIPKIGENEDVLQESFKLKNIGDVSKTILKSKGQYYILKLKSLKNLNSKENSEESDKKLLAESKNKSSQLMSSWLDSEQKKSEIKKNNTLFQN